MYKNEKDIATIGFAQKFLNMLWKNPNGLFGQPSISQDCQWENSWCMFSMVSGIPKELCEWSILSSALVGELDFWK